MDLKAFWWCVAALLCASQTKAAGNNEVRVEYNRGTETGPAGKQPKTSTFVVESGNVERPDRELAFETKRQTVEVKKNVTHIGRGTESSGHDVKTFEMSTKDANYDRSFHPGGSTGKTGTFDTSMQKDGSMHIPHTQKSLNGEASGSYAFDGSVQRTPDSAQISSVNVEHTSQVSGNGAFNKNPDVLKYNSGGTVQSTKFEFPTHTSGVSVTANHGSSFQGQPDKSTSFNIANSEGGGYVLPDRNSIPQNSVGFSTAVNGEVTSGSSIPQNSVGIKTAGTGTNGYVFTSGSSIPQNSVGINTASVGGGGYVLAGGSNIPQIPSGSQQTTKINAGFPVAGNTGGYVSIPTYKPTGTVSIGGGGFGGSYGQTSGSFIPGNIAMPQGFRIPTIGYSGAVRPVGGQISGGMLSGRSQTGVMFPVGTQQMKMGYGINAANRQMSYIPQTQVRLQQVPVMKANPVYTSFATSGSVPTTGVRMTYGQNQIRSPSVTSGMQLRIPSSNIQYTGSAGVPFGTVQVSG